MSLFVDTQWLEDNLNNKHIKVIDGTWFMPNAGRNAYEEYLDTHIPGAVFFDIDRISDTTSPYPHMLPSAEDFSEKAGQLGLKETDHLVIYDRHGLFSAARVWWTFKTFGATRVSLLKGGLPRWLAEGRPIESGPTKCEPSKFDAVVQLGAVLTMQDMENLLQEGRVQILDARPAARFWGEAPEPRPGLRSGHMPGAYSLPFSNLVQNGELLSSEALQQVFQDAGIDLSKPCATTCGSGVTAAIITLALTALKAPAVGLYDGSWSEWGAQEHTAVATRK